MKLSPADIGGRSFKSSMDGYHTDEHVHFACAVTE